MASLKVEVDKAIKIPNVGMIGKSNPYILVEFNGATKKTTEKKAELNPVWNEILTFDLQAAPRRDQNEVKICVMDATTLGRDNVLGRASVKITHIIAGDTHKKWSEKKQITISSTECVVHLVVTYEPSPDDYRPPSRGQSDAGSVIIDIDGVDGDQDGDDDNYAEDQPLLGDEVDGGNKKKRKKKGAHKKRTLSQKVQHFQVRIHVCDARQLPGAKINPVVRISCCTKTKQTTVKKSTHSPVFNELFFFNFKCSPAHLFGGILTFSVYNSKTLGRDELIGSFKCNIGKIYEEDSHAHINKWLLLCNPEEDNCVPKGYLRMSVAVLAAGDEAPNLMQAGLESFKNGDAEDSEENLMQTGDVQLKPATFKINLYKAEDMPRLDSASMFSLDEGPKKNLVDPYAVVSFAGAKQKSKTIKSNDHPEFNQEIRLALQWPSMCERIRIELWDWDTVGDDEPIGITTVNLSNISSAGDSGFLPTFGPCFINFYGSPREFTTMQNDLELLNYGKGEGCAYRGRALLDLSTILQDAGGETGSKNMIKDICKEDIDKIVKFQQRSKFKLCCAIMDATMVSVNDTPVQFEVSIGNHGNILDDALDESYKTCNSTTLLSSAVFDGHHYYYIPWSGRKPCMLIDSQWEDIRFRLRARNLISNIQHRLAQQLERAKKYLTEVTDIIDVKQQLQILLAQFILDCKRDMPTMQKFANDLDRKIMSYRKTVLSEIRDDSKELLTMLDLQDTKPEDVIDNIETFLIQLEQLTVEPQNSIPDIIIWMIANKRRIAYHRCPAYDLLWDHNPDYRGKLCGKLHTIQLKYPRLVGTSVDQEDRWWTPASLRLNMWFGLEKDEHKWQDAVKEEGELGTFAEIYETQEYLITWQKKGEKDFSEIKDSLELSADWRWDSNWTVDVGSFMLYEADAGHTHFLDVVYEAQSRQSEAARETEEWQPDSTPWSDAKGEPTTGKDAMQPPPGWKWEDAWSVELNRAVDEDGWEYNEEGGYVTMAKSKHEYRRRLWIRKRNKVTDADVLRKKKTPEGWEYSSSPHGPYRVIAGTTDTVRRRRWLRKVIPDDKEAPEDFVDLGKMKATTRFMTSKLLKGIILNPPRTFLTMKTRNKFQLRAYMYEARDIIAGDSNGLSDPFLRVCFLNQSQQTEKLDKTVCPKWDQTLIFEDVEIFGDPAFIKQNPPEITIEAFDHDVGSADDYLGRCTAHPLLKLQPDDKKLPVLQWYNFKKDLQEGGQLFAAFELILITDDNQADVLDRPPKKEKRYIVPKGIRPVIYRKAIEVLCWGVRNMGEYHLSSINSPQIEFEIGGQLLKSSVIKSVNVNPNFDNPIIFFDVEVEKNPSVNIRVRDIRQFGYSPIVGNYVVRSLDEYQTHGQSRIINVQDDQETETTVFIDEHKEQPALMARADSCAVNMSGGGLFTEPPVEVSQKVASTMISRSQLSHPPAKQSKIVDQSDKKKPKKKKKRKNAVGIPSQTVYVDWWSKYYASCDSEEDQKKCRNYVENGYDKLKIFSTELEKEYKNFEDFCHKFPFSRGQTDDGELQIIGELKANFCMYDLPERPEGDDSPKTDDVMPTPHWSRKSLPLTDPDGDTKTYMIRIYIVKAIDLQPNDPTGLADPYVEVTLGQETRDSKDEYVPNTLNPIFGKVFEMKSAFPSGTELVIRIKDWDLIGSDDVIGETVIDLENRYLSKHRGSCGLPKSYCVTGPCEWRDVRKPTEILKEFCVQHGLQPPVLDPNNELARSLTIGRDVYRLAEFECEESTKAVANDLGPNNERLSLYVLNHWSAKKGVNLVPEHVERRSLYSPLQPGIEQGKVEMWVDILPMDGQIIRDPVYIAPRKPSIYELRIVIWNTADVILDDISITGEAMSDIFVKGWISGIDAVQSTDIHYRSVDGTGEFNWRFVFPFNYLLGDDCLVVHKKRNFWSLHETEQHLPPKLIIEIWDNDIISADDYLGSLELDLNNMIKPARSSDSCTLDMLDREKNKDKTFSLFDQKRIKGYWPCINSESGVDELTGKVAMEIELVCEEDALKRPTGQGREEPNNYPKLEPPNRPDTSFLWFTSPWKTFKHIVWKRYKWKFIAAFIILFLVIFLVLFVYSVPSAVSSAIFEG